MFFQNNAEPIPDMYHLYNQHPPQQVSKSLFEELAKGLNNRQRGGRNRVARVGSSCIRIDRVSQ